MDSADAVSAGARLGDIAALSAQRIGTELVALFGHVARMPDKMQWVQREIAADLPGPLDPALARACADIASAIDDRAVAFDRHPYHGRQHFCEVALSGYILCLLNRLDGPAIQFVLLAALIHDFGHDGSSRQPFVQERASVERARPLLEAAGIQGVRLERLRALVLATDPSCGIGFMAAACRAPTRDERLALPVPAEAPELALLAGDGELAQFARILCEADVLPSVGLNVAHALQLQERLAREWSRPLGEHDKLAFIDHVLRQGYISDYFLPNVLATRQALAGSARAARPA